MFNLRFYVLWHNKAGLPVWSGPYESFEQASRATAMQDRYSDAFVVMTSKLFPAPRAHA